MRKTNVLALAVVVALAFGANAAASAFAVEWLEGGVVITTAQEALFEGEMTLEDNKVPLVGKAVILCSGILLGSVGPDRLGVIDALLALSGAEVTELAGLRPLETCTDVANCSKPRLYAEKLPWSIVLVAGPKIQVSGSAYDSVCETIIGLVEDLCENTSTKPTEITIANAAIDVESPAGTVASPNGNCTQGGTESGVNTFETAMLIHLVLGEVLQVS